FYHNLLHSEMMPPQGRNRGRYRNARVDELVEQGRILNDPVKRSALYREVHRIIHEELPFLSLWHNHTVAVEATGLEPLRLHPSGGFEHLPALRWRE
ncbi:MAG: hypothetical protein OEW39_15590, partial [Deltaproteobacteria bacterium]|nr:hypothetical protein [Deltaproteobacteria bacterium]